MSPQRRTALVSVFAALVLIALKLVAGIHSGSLGLLSEAAHSGTDLVAALLTFFAIGVAGRPPDVGRPRPPSWRELRSRPLSAMLVLNLDHLVQKKRKGHPERVAFTKVCPATSYSPTSSHLQYHRR